MSNQTTLNELSILANKYKLEFTNALIDFGLECCAKGYQEGRKQQELVDLYNRIKDDKRRDT
jgi:hypothetical protein